MLHWGLAAALALALLLLGVQEWRRRAALRERERRSREFAAGEARFEAFAAYRARVSAVVASLQRASSLAELGQAFMAQAAPTIGAHYGVLYILDKDTRRLEQVGGYGLTLPPAAHASFALGEGMVGQCALDMRGVTVHALQDTTIRVVSGLGEAAPRQLLLQALVQTGAAVGVLEFAALTAFNPLTREFLEELMPTLAMSIAIIDRDVRTRSLLEAKRAQAAQLEAQQTALREAAETRDEANKKLQEQIAELAAARRAMLNIMEDLEEARVMAEAARETRGGCDGEA